MDRGAWWATVYGLAKCQTRLSDFHFHFGEWSPGGKRDGAAKKDPSFKDPDLEDWGRGEDIRGECRLREALTTRPPGQWKRQGRGAGKCWGEGTG